jgi:hypothetical protein
LQIPVLELPTPCQRFGGDNAQHSEVSMTALLKKNDVQSAATSSAEAAAASLFGGEAVEMFSSGSAPSADLMTGGGAEMFSSGSAPCAADSFGGAAVSLFSSGSAPVADGSQSSGALTGLFFFGLGAAGPGAHRSGGCHRPVFLGQLRQVPL